MGEKVAAAKTLVIPAVISLLLFVVMSYVLIPLWRQYRSRYSHYLPLDTISNHTSSFRSRLQDAIARWLVPSQWRLGMRDRLVQADEESDAGFESDGEELEDVLDNLGADRRHALSLDANVDHTDSIRRLSRDLEEGFRDDSDDEADTRNRSR
ncbi:checkpoint protein hus1 protein [Apiospora marii]|uniref:checkpoint protein hus1 protein n=1 Tax=Apiospora marii TaxID=335849 RepID=UPI0031322F07